MTAYLKPEVGESMTRSCSVVTAATGDIELSITSQEWSTIASKPFHLQFVATNGPTVRLYPEDGPIEVLVVNSVIPG